VWFAIAIAIGAGIAITVISSPKFTAAAISDSILDVNILKVIRPNTGLGAMMIARMFSFAVSFAIIFVLSFKKWTVIIIFPLAGYKGFEIFINLYWTITKFGMATGIVLLITYFVFLTVLLVITLAAAIYCMRLCEPVRLGGFRCGVDWNGALYNVLKFFGAVFVFALAEYFVYYLILSKLVFVV
jgi:hypothetical protein